MCSLVVILGVIPFAGIFLYLWMTGMFNGVLAGLGVSVPIAMTVALVVFGLVAGLVFVFMTIVAIVFILKLLFG